MRLTIVTQTASVGKDEVFFEGLDLSSCGVPLDVWALQWYDTYGHIEFIGAAPNEDIPALPDWASNCLSVWQTAYEESLIPPPPTAENNKLSATVLLQGTDWTTIPDVCDPTKSDPYLANANEFVAYRNAVRQYAVYPVAGDIDWPTPPQEVWVKVQP
jgi:hypothetical protein